MVARFKNIHTLFFNKWFFDEIYNSAFVKNAICAGNMFWKGDKNIVDGVGPDGVAARSLQIGRMLKRFQTGYVFHYAFVMIAGVIGFVTWFSLRFNRWQGRGF